MGLRSLKIDFLFAGTYEDERHRSSTGLQAYNSPQIDPRSRRPRTGLLLVSPAHRGIRRG